MRLSIASKIVLVTASGIVIAAVSVMAIIFLLMGRAADAQLDSSVRQSKIVVEEYYKIIETNLLNTNKNAAADPALPALVQPENYAALVRWSQDIMRDSNADLCTITDAQGVVLARAHTDQKGDSLADQGMVRAALSGKSISGIVVSSLTPFSVQACVPVVTNGKLVGTLSLGISIVTENFVDALKRLSGLEVTIFKGNTRVMSTITNGGKRVINTQLGNPAIEAVVLEQRQTAFRDLVIFNIPYKAAYWPVIDIDNKVTGMWFVGQSIQRALDERRNALLLGLAAMLGIAACLGGFSVFFGKRLALPIKEVTFFSQEIAHGRLDTVLRVKTTDEVGVLADSLKSMVETLKARIAESEQKSLEAAEHSKKAQAAVEEANKAKESAELGRKAILAAAERVDEVVSRLSSATEEVSVQTEQASRGTETQRDRVMHSSTAMEEMNATVMEVAKNAGIAAEGSDRAREKAKHGAAIVQASVNSIDTVQKDTEALRQNMEDLRRQAESIGTIMTVISDIADQTNLLALNAAIEAARAGDAGRGFAVVADEVRKLAEKTMNATQEVGSAISGIQGEAKQSIAAVERTTEKLQETTELAQKSGAALADIVEEVNTTATQVSSIATAAEQQSATSEEISGSLDEINRMAEENTTAMHQSSQAVSELAQLAQELQVLVDKLRDE